MGRLEFRNVTKKFENGKVGVRNFSLLSEEKEFLVLVGPSGCGKSTLLRMLAGLEDLTEGEILWKDEWIHFKKPQERGFSMVFQNYALYPHLNVFDNIAFSLQLRKKSKHYVKEKVYWAAKLLSIESLLECYPRQLSGGQKQRVAIGASIVRNPELFLMDEPLSNLDAKLREQMRTVIANIYRELDATILYVTHDQVEAMTLGTRIVVLKQGEVQQIATPEQLYFHPKNYFVASFIGNPSMNFFSVTVEKRGCEYFVHTQEGELPLPQDLGRRLEERQALNTTLLMGIRPEDILEGRQWHGKIASCERIGAFMILYIDTEYYHIVSKIPLNEKFTFGKRMDVDLDLSKAYFFDEKTEKNILEE